MGTASDVAPAAAVTLQRCDDDSGASGCGVPGCADASCPYAYGECHCGCGGETTLATRSDARAQLERGKPRRYKRGHGGGAARAEGRPERRARREERYRVLGSLAAVAAEEGVSEQAIWKDLHDAGAELAPPGGRSRPEVAKRRELVGELAEQGLVSSAIAARLDEPLVRVEADLRVLGLSGRHVRRQLRRRHVAELYPEKSCAEIARALDVTVNTAWFDVVALELARRRPGRRRVPYGQGDGRRRNECALSGCEATFVVFPYNLGRRRYCSIGHAIADAWRPGAGLARAGGLVNGFPPAKRRKWKLLLAPKPGRQRASAKAQGELGTDWEQALNRIRALYDETHATERDLQRLYAERFDCSRRPSRRTVRLALGRPV